MARCYHCGKVLEDAWLKRQGAALMGKTRGEAKARTPEQARRAGLARAERAALARSQSKAPPPPEPPPKKRRKKKT